MSRRVLAVAGAAALLAVALPALPALAVGESGSAALVVGKDLFPGATQQLRLSVSNTSFTGAVNAFRLTFPPSAAGITASASQPLPGAGFKVSRASNGSSLFFEGGAIPAGGTLEVPVAADVTAPAADRSGKFTVTMSQDGGANGFGASDSGLTSTVRVLQVTASAPTAPAGVTDKVATGGQGITESFTVTNRGSAPLTVTPTLRSSNSADAITAPSAVLLAAGASISKDVPVTLASAASDRVSTFTTGATATGATAPAGTSAVTVQQPAGLAVGAVTPSALRPGISYAFTVPGSKTGSPKIESLSGSLSFAPRADGTSGTTAALTGPTKLTTNTADTLTFASTVVAGDGTVDSAGKNLGDNKSYPVAVQLKALDDNGFSYPISVSPTNQVTLDALAPVVTATYTLPTDADGRTQTAAKNNDVIAYSGTLDNCKDTLNSVVLTPNVGSTVAASPVPTPSAGSNGTCTFSGTFPKSTFDPAATSFTVAAQATDAAGNPGGGGSKLGILDNVAPAVTYSKTLSTTQILVRFAEQNKVYGGCAPSQYKVEGDPLVTRVLYSDGSTCTPGAAGPDNDRVLVLSSAKDPDFSTTVSYTPAMRPWGDPAKDDASSDAAAAAVKTVVGVAPAPPVLVKATRNGGSETAYTESGSGSTGPTYYTRKVGNDLVLQFTGGRLGYSAQVLDAAGKSVALVPAGSSPAVVTVPLASTADGTYAFSLRLLNGQSIPSTTVPFRVVLDQVKPALASVTQGTSLDPGASSVAVGFSEPVVAGTDYAFDWTVEQDTAAAGTTYYAVTKVANTDATTRTLTTQGALASSGTTRAAYELVSTTGKAYEDKAGNTLPTPTFR